MDTAHTTQAPTDAGHGALQCLAFRLGGQDYGIPILHVQEIRERSRLTALPHSPPYIQGVLNLRGAVVPVIDLRARFQLEPLGPGGPAAVVVVVSVKGRLAGLVVDAVSDVIQLGPDQCQAVPEFEGHAHRRFLSGLATVDGKMLILLDVERLLNPDEWDRIGGPSQ